MNFLNSVHNAAVVTNYLKKSLFPVVKLPNKQLNYHNNKLYKLYKF